MNRMKLVVATDNYLPRYDGIARFLSEVLSRIKHRYDITVIAPAFNGTKSGIKDGIKEVRVPLQKKQRAEFPFARFESKLIRRELKDADIVFTQTIGPVGATALYNAHKMKKKIVAFMHSVEWELVPMAVKSHFLRMISYPLTKHLARYLYSKCDLLLLPAQSILDSVSWEVRDIPKSVVHLGCDTNVFKPAKSKAEAKKRLGISPDTIVVGYHGRLSREKDLRTGLRGFLRVGRKHNKHFLVVGDGLESIKKMLARPKVTHQDSVDDVVPFLQAMDIYVLSSLTETTCLSILEAMACEVAVATTKVGFVKDYISDGKNGLFFDVGNSWQLAKKLEYLMLNPVKMKTMGRSARETVKKRFDWNMTVKDIENAFKTIE